MTIVRWNQLREVPMIQNRMNRLFDDFFTDAPANGSDVAARNWLPVVDIYDSENSTVIQADLPGMDKENISINMEENVLTLSGERSYENDVEKTNYYRKERAFGTFKREFTLPTSVDHEKIKADFKDGVLKIEIPKPEEKKPKSISIH
jgi:HSP20 family protein